MFLRANERKVERKENLRGGDGTIVMGSFLPDEKLFHTRLISKIEVAPGCSIGRHAHTGEYEAYYFLEGEITLDDNGTTIKALPGDFSICFDGQSHGFRNDTKEPASLLAFIITKAE
ncbi:MAG: cupin domain-containing protein [Eubacteriales bacterium]|nr:cupin domain-containing protein [Eubacteriales bacterium]